MCDMMCELESGLTCKTRDVITLTLVRWVRTRAIVFEPGSHQWSTVLGPRRSQMALDSCMGVAARLHECATASNTAVVGLSRTPTVLESACG